MKIYSSPVRQLSCILAYLFQIRQVMNISGKSPQVQDLCCILALQGTHHCKMSTGISMDPPLLEGVVDLHVQGALGTAVDPQQQGPTDNLVSLCQSVPLCSSSISQGLQVSQQSTLVEHLSGLFSGPNLKFTFLDYLIVQIITI